MKKKPVFNMPLLLSQEEMAMLLGVTRSQWSMYVLGQRGLPSSEVGKFADFLLLINEISSAAPDQPALLLSEEQERKYLLSKHLKDNQRQLLKLQKELKKMEEKFQAALNTLQLVALLKNQTTTLKANATFIAVLQSKASKAIQVNSRPSQEHLKIKLAVLKHEKKLLESEMKKLV